MSMATTRSTTRCIVGESCSNTVRPFHAADVLRDEFLGIEVHRIAGATSSIADVGQWGHGRFVGDEDVQPPAAIGIRLQMVEEAAVAMLGQLAADLVAVGICCPTISYEFGSFCGPGKAVWCQWCPEPAGAVWDALGRFGPFV
jgi:hypothetical protein